MERRGYSSADGRANDQVARGIRIADVSRKTRRPDLKRMEREEKGVWESVTRLLGNTLCCPNADTRNKSYALKQSPSPMRFSHKGTGMAETLNSSDENSKHTLPGKKMNGVSLIYSYSAIGALLRLTPLFSPSIFKSGRGSP
jgi:hypothetical protein